MAGRHFKTRSACPGCGSNNFKVVYSRPYSDPEITHYLTSHYEAQGKPDLALVSDATFDLARCANCEMVFQVDIPDDFLMQEVYEKWIDPVKIFQIYDGVMPLYAFGGLAEDVLSLAIYFERPPHELKFFDFGMGWGVWCRMALGFGIDTYGTELSQSRIDHARKYGIKVITWDEIPQQQFHYINTEQVFEHIPEPLETLRHLKRSLRPEGLIKISVPNPLDIDERLRTLNWRAERFAADGVMPVQPLEHINCFTHNTILKMAEVAGFERVTIPVGVQWAAGNNWRPVVPMIKNLFRPFYRNFIWKRTSILLRAKRPAV